MLILPRFSIRTILVATAISAAGCWWVVRPTAVARRFVAAIAAQDFAAADSLGIDPNRRFVNGAIYHFVVSDKEVGRSYYSPEITRRGRPPCRIEANLLRWSWHDLWRGQRQLELLIERDPPPNRHVTGLTPVQWDLYGNPVADGLRVYNLIATRNGIWPPPDAAPMWNSKRHPDSR
jgi:hypothetical protein